MTDLTTIEACGGYVAYSTISSSTTTSIPTYRYSLISSSITYPMLTTLFFLLHLECILGVILHHLEGAIVVDIMVDEFKKFTKVGVICFLILL
jgi:hypothetical protein